MLKDRARLLEGDARKEIGEFADWNAVLEVLKKRSNGHTRTTEHPRAANAFRVLLYCIAGRPINHASDASTPLAQMSPAA